MTGKLSSGQEIDALFTTLRPWGYFQIIQLYLVFSLSVPCANELFSLVYIGYQPPVRCKGLNRTSLDWTNTSLGNVSDYLQFHRQCGDVVDLVNGSRVIGSCSRGFEYNQPKEASFVSEWDLVCDRSYWAQLPQSMFIVGQLIGASFFTWLADKYGRRTASLTSHGCLMVASFASAWSPNINALIVFKFIAGAFQQGVVTSFAVISLELLRTENRAWCFLLLGTTFAVAQQLLNGLGYLFRYTNWRYLQLTISGIVAIFLLPNVLFLEETLRWLFVNGRRKDAEKVIKKAIRQNKAPESAVWDQADKCYLENTVTQSESESKNGAELRPLTADRVPISTPTNGASYAVHESILTILKSPQLLKTAIIMVYVWIVSTLTFFGLILTSPKLAGDRFVNFTLMSIDMIPATIISYFIISRFGRKVGCVSAAALSGVSLIAAVLIRLFAGSRYSPAVMTFTILGKLGTSASFTLLFQYTPELYPTNIRSFGMGFSSSAARLGGAVAPFSNLLMDIVPWAPGVIFGVCSLISALLIMLLPETLDKNLPQTLLEINNWKEKKTPTTEDIPLTT